MIKPIVYNGQTPEQLFGKRDRMSNDVQGIVSAIIDDVKRRGDDAVREYSRKFDGYDGEFEVTKAEIQAAVDSLDPEYIKMLERAADNIKAFHQKQKRGGFELKLADGRILGQKVTPVSSVAVYIPGGTAAYPSTVLMNVIPAKIAGVKNVVMVTPVKADGAVKPEVLAAAELCGADRIYKMGGAQAIAALAYGTQSVTRVDKITGPGNAFVAEAKRQVSGVACGIDMVAGPSEILIIADRFAEPDCVAADMLSQAEHDKLASAVLICDDMSFARKTLDALYARLNTLPRREIAMTSVQNNCRVVIVPDIDRAVELADCYAPEHLELCVKEPMPLLDKVHNAGSVFLGYNTPEAVGDYYAGANHTLPTSGTARFSSPLGVDDFVKTTQYVYYPESALKAAADDITVFAESEGLYGHAESIRARMKK